MIVNTSVGKPVNSEAVTKYFDYLVNHFFKILPIRESEEESLPIYIRSFLIELLGCGDLIPDLGNNSSFLTLISILQYFSSNPRCEVADVRREVFRAINICNRLKTIYMESEVKDIT